jgi:uridine phosphorylase
MTTSARGRWGLAENWRRLNVLMTQEEYSVLVTMAKAKGMTTSALVRELIVKESKR